MDRSRMRRIPQNSFQNCGNLESINFQLNQIEEVPAGLFEPCTNLKRLLLSGNNITNLGISPESFRGLANLQVLWIGSGLNSINRELFEYIPKLEELRLNGNRIPVNQIANLPNSLRTLTLAFNQLENLPANVFQGLCLRLKICLCSTKTKRFFKRNLCLS